MNRENENKMIFIVGMARTGTTLMARILSKGSDAYFLHETHFMREYKDYILEEKLFGKNSEKFINKIIKQFITIQRNDYYRKFKYREYPEDVNQIKNMFATRNKKNFIELLRCLFLYEAKRNGKIYPGDQTPNHVFFIEQIRHCFPEAIFINMIRDPRAVVLSQKNKWKASKRLKQPVIEIIRTKINYHPITQSVLWLKAVKSGNSAFNNHGEKVIQRVFYEQLVEEPEKHIRKVCKFCGIGYDKGMLNTPVSMSSNIFSSPAKGLDPTLKDKWRSMLSSTEIFLIEFICGDCASNLGYKMIHCKPKYFILLIYIIIFPVHIMVAYLLSANRFRNPISAVKNIFHKK